MPSDPGMGRQAVSNTTEAQPYQCGICESPHETIEQARACCPGAQSRGDSGHQSTAADGFCMECGGRDHRHIPACSAYPDRLTCRDPDLDLDALERAHGRVLSLYRSCVVGGAVAVAAEWEALLVASGYGWPARPKEATDAR